MGIIHLVWYIFIIWLIWQQSELLQDHEISISPVNLSPPPSMKLKSMVSTDLRMMYDVTWYLYWCPFGLVVWFLLRVQEVPGSNPGMDPSHQLIIIIWGFCAGVVNGADLKSAGLCPHRFDPCQNRVLHWALLPFWPKAGLTLWKIQKLDFGY